MLITGLASDPAGALRYMERWVNDGSPSGFTRRFSTSRETSPFGGQEVFQLGILRASCDVFRQCGSIPSWPAGEDGTDDCWLLLHPDMTAHPEIIDVGGQIRSLDAFSVVPTSSGRTVQFIDGPTPAYAKLHYDGILGRVNRRLGWKRAVSGVEVSEAIVAAMDSAAIDPRIAILREPGARAVVVERDSAKIDWGMTWREAEPWGGNASSMAIMVPCFSLFSADQINYRHQPLLPQLVAASGRSAQDYCLEALLLPIVDCYFSVIAGAGLQPEWNAQNLIIGLSEDLDPVGVVMRDLESVDKDITIRRLLKLPCEFESFPHKCIEMAQFNYQIKHSFMFDFKLAQYVIEPILQAAVNAGSCDIEDMRLALKSRVMDWLTKLPGDFFPEDGRWYAFSPVLIDQTSVDRPYVSFPNPPFR